MPDANKIDTKDFMFMHVEEGVLRFENGEKSLFGDITFSQIFIGNISFEWSTQYPMTLELCKICVMALQI